MVIDFKKAKLKLQIKKFKKSGIIPNAIYAGHQLPSQTDTHWANLLLIVEKDRDYNYLLYHLKANSTQFMLPYTLSKYKKDINPITALYEELQSALFKYKTKRNKFDNWIIQYCKNNINNIVKAIKKDIKNINTFFKKYKTSNDTILKQLLKNLNKYLLFFQQFN